MYRKGKAKGTKKGMEKKGRRMRIGMKIEKIAIAAIILVAFVGAVKNALVLYSETWVIKDEAKY